MESAASIATDSLRSDSPPKGRYDPFWRVLALALNGAVVALPFLTLLRLQVFAIFLVGIATSAMIAIAGFAVTVIALNRWRLTRAPLLALIVPGVFLVLFVVPGARAVSDITELLYSSLQFAFQILVLAAVLRLFGFHLYVSRADYIIVERWQYSIRSFLIVSIFVAIYTSVILDLVSNGPITNAISRWLGVATGTERMVPYTLLFMQVAVLATATSLMGWWGWIANVLVGTALFLPAWYFPPATMNYQDRVLVAYMMGCVVLCSTIITMPWIGLGWRVRWDKPIWEREFKPAAIP